MWHSLLNLSWRLLLALSLAVGPWPPAAWAVIVPDSDAKAMSDCHGATEASAAPAQADTPCDDGCCSDPACDPTHCLVLHAVMAPVHRRVDGAIPGLGEIPGVVARAPRDPPRLTLLRPPIA